MDSDELQIFRDEFTTIDPANDLSLRNWFSKYPELTTQERCMITGMSEATINRWQQRVGITPLIVVEIDNDIIITHKQPPTPKIRNVQVKYNLDVPENWRQNRAWLENTYNLGISERSFANMVGCSRTRIRKILKRNGIELRTHNQAVSSKNPCCTKEWIEYNYYDCQKDLRQCAKLAGVSTTTILQWMAKYSISTRGQRDASFLAQKIKKHT